MAASFTCVASLEGEDMDFFSLQINCLNDIAREEKFDRPIHKYANLSF
jgi:hypothetical protein